MALFASMVPYQSTTPPLADLLQRVGAYVNAYGKGASAFVATETYTQSVTGDREPGSPVARTTIAEFAVINTSGSLHWIGFRDIIEVDGKSLTDHRDRLLALLTEPEGSLDGARQLSQESARFNIGPIERNINVPTTALFFFTSENLDRFKFRIAGNLKPDLLRLEFKETRTPTLIESSGRSLVSEGELIVDPGGVVHETILRVRGFSERIGVPIQSTVDVTYARLADQDVWLPSVMIEEYVIVRPNGAHIQTRAQYSNYRRFQTSAKIK